MSAGGRPCPTLAEAGSRPQIDRHARSTLLGGCGVPGGALTWPLLSSRRSGRLGMPLARAQRTNSRRTAAAACCPPVVVVAAPEPPEAEHPAIPASSSTSTRPTATAAVPPRNLPMTPPWFRWRPAAPPASQTSAQKAPKPPPRAHHRRGATPIPPLGNGRFPFRGRPAASAYAASETSLGTGGPYGAVQVADGRRAGSLTSPRGRRTVSGRAVGSTRALLTLRIQVSASHTPRLASCAGHWRMRARPAPTRLGGPLTPCRHRNCGAGSGRPTGCPSVVLWPMRGTGHDRDPPASRRVGRSGRGRQHPAVPGRGSGRGTGRPSAARRRGALAEQGARRRRVAGRAAGDVAGAVALLGGRVRLAQGRGQAERVAAVQDAHRRPRQPLRPREVTARGR